MVGITFQNWLHIVFTWPALPRWLRLCVKHGMMLERNDLCLARKKALILWEHESEMCPCVQYVVVPKLNRYLLLYIRQFLKQEARVYDGFLPGCKIHFYVVQ